MCSSINIFWGKDKLSRGYQRFSDDTDITGFKELYYAKSTFFKTIWLLLLIFAVSFTAYQCCYTILEYVDQPTNTVIQQLRDKPSYPPLKLCYAHWIYWLDWSKFQSLNLNLDRESFLYSMSYLKTVFVETNFTNFTLAKEKFQKMMALQNYSNLNEYYLSIARDQPLGIDLSPINKPRIKFHDYFDSGVELCYEYDINFSAVNKTSKRGQLMKLNIEFHYDIQIDYISQQEVNYYRRAAFAYQSMNNSLLILYGNETEIFVSPMIYADGTENQVILDLNYFQYVLRLKANVYKWRQSDDRPCQSEFGIDFGGMFIKTCSSLCDDLLPVISTMSCIEFGNATGIRKYTTDITCRKNFVLANLNLNGTTVAMYKRDPTNKTLGDILVNEIRDAVNYCPNKCIRPCEEWIFETSTVANLRPPQLRDQSPSKTYVEISYPTPDTIIVMQEIPSQTWQKMLADVGGLLGLWIGTTLFSFFQMIYLCCCKEIDENWSTIKEKEKYHKRQSLKTEPSATTTMTTTTSNGILPEKAN